MRLNHFSSELFARPVCKIYLGVTEEFLTREKAVER